MKMNRHHRKAKALLGTNLPENVVTVPVHLHEAWNRLFVSYQKNEGKWLPDTPERICRKINAFNLLFRGMMPQDICNALNTVWADPDYSFEYLLTTNGPEFVCVKR